MNASTALKQQGDVSALDIGDDAFQSLAKILHQETGIVLSDSKKGLAVSRLSKRLRQLSLPDFDAYCSYLQGPSGSNELQNMIQQLTTNVTRFFREPHHFESLASKILPGLLDRAKRGGRVRIWSAGCSSGEEPYSIALTLLDLCPEIGKLDVKILATDIDQQMVKSGKNARYAITSRDLDAHRLLRSGMRPVGDGSELYEVAPEAKRIVHFAPLNLLKDWPMRGLFDVIFCRNVVIYFDDRTQKALWSRFSQILAPNGYLMIGHSERVTGEAESRLRSDGVTQYRLQV